MNKPLSGSFKDQLDKYLEYKNLVEGKTFYTYYGTPYVVLEYNGYRKKSKIVFPFSGIEKEISIRNITDITESKLKAADPFHNDNNGNHYPFVFKSPMDAFRNIVFISNGEHEPYKVIDYKSYSDVTIQFLNPPYYIKEHVNERYIRNGAIKNPYHINSFGGYLGEDKTFCGKSYNWLLAIWSAVVLRANNHEKYNSYKSNINHRYDDCTICNEWLNYSIFARDYINKLSLLNPNYDYDLDKDLLYPYYKNKTGGLKLYSNDTTLLLPKEINRQFIQFTPYNNFYTSRFKKCGDIYRYKKFIEKMENWKSKFDYYLKENCISMEVYNILNNLRLENLRIVKELNPELENKRINEHLM